MSKASSLQSNFNGGEFSPLAVGRVDIDRYPTGLATCLNYIPMLQGGKTRRTGTKFVEEVKDSTKTTRLIPFEFSTEQAYMLEFSPSVIRVYKNRALVTDAVDLVSNGTFDTDLTDWDSIGYAGRAVWSSSYGGSLLVTGTDLGINPGWGAAEQDVTVSVTGTHTLSFTVHAATTSAVLNVGTSTGATDIYTGSFGVGDHTLDLSLTAGTVYVGFAPYDGFGADSNTVYVDSVSLVGDSGTPLEIVSPYAEADLSGISYTQSADILYLFHEDYATRTLSRTSDTSWTLNTFTPLDGPYLPTNTTAVTITPDDTTGTVTLTASSATFVSTDVGRLVRLEQAPQDWAASTAYVLDEIATNDSGKVYECTTAGTSAGSGGPTGTGQAITDGTVTWRYVAESLTWFGWATISVFNSTTSVDAVVGGTLGGTTATAAWRLGLWSDTTGYPSSGTFHEDRLCFAGVPDAPQRVDGSNSGDYTNFAPTDTDGTITDAHAISFTLNANQVNAIRWLVSGDKGLLAGTTGGEWSISPSSLGEALSPTNVKAKRVTAYGSANVEPVQAGRAVLFIQAALRKVRELRYFFSEDSVDAPDLTILAEHVTQSGVTGLARQKEPQPLVWAARQDGVLACVTYERDQDTLRVGWHRHILGGVGTGTDSAPEVESIAVIATPDGTAEELWLVVKRFVNGSSVRYVEYLTPFFDDTLDQEEAYFVDCGLSYSGTETSSFSGLDHLEGETLQVLADGAVHPDVTVSSGAVTLNYAATRVHIGYTYDSDGQRLRAESGARDGPALGKLRRAHSAMFLLHRTLGLKVGMDFDNLDEIKFRTSADTDDTAVPLYSGVKQVPLSGQYDTEGQLCWRQSDPLPGTILAINLQQEVQDRG